MFDDCECELCGAPATQSDRGIHVCEDCDPFDGITEDEPPHWPVEIPSGLMGIEEHAA